jgi:murein DD-endopeptidase MepM/ murein hydrolase activator NlpD
MFENEYRPPPPPPPQAWLHKNAFKVIIPLVAALVLLPIAFFHRSSEKRIEPTVQPPEAPPSEPTPLPGPSLLLYGYPTPQTLLNEIDNPKVYMPTGSGRVESALYGSTRTNSSGLAQFHEGVDIGPMRWNRAGRAEDAVFAVADGRVGYISRVAGNSSYGIYVVLLHEDPAGEIYTLYSHLASVVPELKKGQKVTRGQTLGIMGNTTTLGIPLQRSHLHFEIGLMLNRHFGPWFRAQNLKPDHAEYHGFNLFGMDPLLLLLQLTPESPQPFSVLKALQEMPPAWRLAFQANGKPDVFVRHPALWEGEAFRKGVIVVDVSEGGVPLRGRNASVEEAEGVRALNPRVLEVNESALGRNGLRHVTRRNGIWGVSEAGKRWLEILLHGAGRG